MLRCLKRRLTLFPDTDDWQLALLLGQWSTIHEIVEQHLEGVFGFCQQLPYRSVLVPSAGHEFLRNEDRLSHRLGMTSCLEQEFGIVGIIWVR